MNRVTGYQTTDGELFTDRQQAKHHQAWIDLQDWAHVMVTEAAEAPPEDLASELARIVALPENAALLAAILKRKPIESGLEAQGDPVDVTAKE